MNDQLLNQAIISYLGTAGSAAYPGKDVAAVSALATSAGVNQAELLSKVHEIDAEFMGIKVDWDSLSLEEGGDEAKQIMAARYPNLDEDVLDALRWKFTYDWR